MPLAAAGGDTVIPISPSDRQQQGTGRHEVRTSVSTAGHIRLESLEGGMLSGQYVLSQVLAYQVAQWRGFLRRKSHFGGGVVGITCT